MAKKIESADLILTGEGKFDASSLRGKGPGTVVGLASKAARKVQIFAGAVGAGIAEGLPASVKAEAISPPELPLAQALKEAPERLKSAVENFLVDLGKVY